MGAEKYTLLVVDDEADILKAYRDIFESKGWPVFTVPTETACWAVLKKEKVDIILLDIRLPERSGIDMLKEIKRGFPSLPVIMVTALGYEDELINEAINQGASGYVSKTAPIRELVGVVKNALGK